MYNDTKHHHHNYPSARIGLPSENLRNPAPRLIPRMEFLVEFDTKDFGVRVIAGMH